jgi:hypothetical protein
VKYPCLIIGGREPGHYRRGRVEEAIVTYNNLLFPLDVLTAALPKFEGAPVFQGHQDPHGARRPLLGSIAGPLRWSLAAGALLGWFEPISSQAARFKQMYLEGAELPALSISVLMRPVDLPDGLTGVSKILEVLSCDVVDLPAAGGRFLTLEENLALCQRDQQLDQFGRRVASAVTKAIHKAESAQALARLARAINDQPARLQDRVTDVFTGSNFNRLVR